MDNNRMTQLIHFLQHELAVSPASIQLALEHPEQTSTLLPMILWQYGLITLTQLDRIFDWLEQNPVLDFTAIA